MPISGQEIGAMVIRLVGDASEYINMLSDSEKATKDTTSRIKATLAEVEKVQPEVYGFAGASSLGGIGTAAGGYGFAADLSSQMAKEKEAKKEALKDINDTLRLKDEEIKKQKDLKKEQEAQDRFLTKQKEDQKVLEELIKGQAVGIGHVADATHQAAKEHEHLMISWMQIHPFLVIMKQVTGMMEFQTYTMLNMALHFAQNIKRAREEQALKKMGIIPEKTEEEGLLQKIKKIGGLNLLGGAAGAAGIIGLKIAFESLDEVVTTVSHHLHFMHDTAATTFGDMVKGAKSFQTSLIDAQIKGINEISDELTEYKTSHGIAGYFKRTIMEFEAGIEGNSTVRGALERRLEQLDKMRDALIRINQHPLERALLIKSYTLNALKQAVEGTEKAASDLLTVGRGSLVNQATAPVRFALIRGMSPQSEEFRQIASYSKAYLELLMRVSKEEEKFKAEQGLFRARHANAGTLEVKMLEEQLRLAGLIKRDNESLESAIARVRDQYAGVLATTRDRLLTEHEVQNTIKAEEEALRGKHAGLEGIDVKILDEQIKQAQFFRKEGESLASSLDRVKVAFADYFSLLRKGMEEGAVNRLAINIRKLNDEVEMTKVKFIFGARAAEVFAIAQQYAVEKGLKGPDRIKKAIEEIAPALKEIDALTRMRNAQKVWEDNLLPMEKFARQVADLKELLGNGLDEETYARAIQKIGREVLGLNRGLEDLKGTSFGTAEALFRFRDFVERVRPLRAAELPHDKERPIPIGINITSPQGKTEHERLTSILSRLADILGEQNKRPVINLEPANLLGGGGAP